MSFIHNSALAGASGQGGVYEIEQSLRFDGGGSKLVLASPTSSYTTSKFTMSCWVKMGPIASDFRMMARDGAPSNVENVWCSFNAFGNNVIVSYMYTASITGRQVLNTLGTQRDPSAWYHIVFGFDSSTGNTQRIWVNGVEQTTNKDTISGVAGFAWSSTYPFVIGGGTSHSYCAEYHFIDNNWLDSPDDFGEYNNQGVWVPKEYTGSYGTNGFYLKFDPSAANGIGHDHSGNGNHLTATGFTTSGAGTDVMSDTPTTNWCTLDPLTNGSFATLSEGNLSAYGNNNTDSGNSRSTFAVTSGKWYCEFDIVATYGGGYPQLGIMRQYDASRPNNGSPASGYTTGMLYPAESVSYWPNGQRSINSVDTLNWGSTWTNGDTIAIALDGDNGAVYFAKNGTWQNSGDPTSGSSKTGAALTWTDVRDYVFTINSYQGSDTDANFGQRAFAYTPPTGFKALNTSNLPAPTIKDGSKYFGNLLYTADNSAGKTVTGLNFGAAPDFVWIKNRDNVESHHLMDVVRGNDSFLMSNRTDAERDRPYADTNDTTDFDFETNGFSFVSTNYNQGELYFNNRTYVGWNWLAGGSVSADNNTAGSITSTVSANPTASFSIVSYTGDGTQFATIGHGLSVAPKMIFVKNRSSAHGWAILHTEVGTTGTTLDGAPEYYMMTFTNDARQNWGSDCVWDPTSTTFKVAATTNSNWVNENGSNHIAYCFAEVEGYSKFGSYTANNTTDNAFVYCGFKPAFLLIKNYTSGGNDSYHWCIYDDTRSEYNATTNVLWPSNTGIENSSSYSPKNSPAGNGDIDFLSNGFKIRSSASAMGGSDSYIFAAFASSPFGGFGVSPATAR